LTFHCWTARRRGLILDCCTPRMSVLYEVLTLDIFLSQRPSAAATPRSSSFVVTQTGSHSLISRCRARQRPMRPDRCWRGLRRFASHASAVTPLRGARQGGGASRTCSSSFQTAQRIPSWVLSYTATISCRYRVADIRNVHDSRHHVAGPRGPRGRTARVRTPVRTSPSFRPYSEDPGQSQVCSPAAARRSVLTGSHT